MADKNLYKNICTVKNILKLRGSQEYYIMILQLSKMYLHVFAQFKCKI